MTTKSRNLKHVREPSGLSIVVLYLNKQNFYYNVELSIKIFSSVVNIAERL